MHFFIFEGDGNKAPHGPESGEFQDWWENGKISKESGNRSQGVGTLSETGPELGWISCKEPKT